MEEDVIAQAMAALDAYARHIHASIDGGHGSEAGP
jgi:hypothetical protein